MGRRSAWLYLAGGAAAAAASPWLTAWLLARTAEPAVVGQYGLALAWLSPVFVLCGLQLRPLLATAADGSASLRVYWRVRAWGIAASILMVGTIGLALDGGGPLTLVLLAAALPKLAELASDLSYGWLTRREEFRCVGASQMLRAGVSLVAFAATWLATRRLAMALLAGGIAALVVTLGRDEARMLAAVRGEREEESVVARQNGMAGSREECSRILRVALPLSGVMFLNHGIVVAPRLWMGGWGMLEGLASLTAVMSLMMIPALLATAYAASLSPHFAEAFRQGGGVALRGGLQRASRVILVAAIPGSVLLIGVGGEALRLLFGETYAVERFTLAGAALFATTWALAAVYGTAATAIRRVWPQATAFGSGLLVSGVAAWLLIPHFGVAGGTWSMGMAGTAVVFVYLAAFHHCLGKVWRARAEDNDPRQGLFASRAYSATPPEPMDHGGAIANVP